jgi:hypothetical protein
LDRGEFVGRMVEGKDERITCALILDQRLKQPKDYKGRICEENDVGVEKLGMESRWRRICKLRAPIAHHLVADSGRPLGEAERQMGVSTSGISGAIERVTEKLANSINKVPEKTQFQVQSETSGERSAVQKKRALARKTSSAFGHTTLMNTRAPSQSPTRSAASL